MYEPKSYALFSGIQLFIILGVYVYYAYCQYTIARKVEHPGPWWAFIPILNLFQTVQLAGKKWYWFLLYWIPFVNLVAWPLAWVEIAKARSKPPVWGVLMLLPFLNLVALAVMAGGPATMRIGDKTYEQQPERERVNVG